MGFLSLASGKQSTLPLFIPYTQLFITEPQLNKPYLVNIIKLITQYTFNTLVDGVISNYYTNNRRWDDKCKDSMLQFIDSKFYYDVENLIMEEVDSISLYNASEATEAIIAFELDDGVLLKYLITSICHDVYRSIEFMVPQVLNYFTQLDEWVEFSSATINLHDVIIRFTVVNSEIAQQWYRGEDALKYY